MIEPTESEDKQELDRFCQALIGKYEESYVFSEIRSAINWMY